MTTLKDIYWLAGLLEGEGTFFFRKTPVISIEMSDKDTIERVKNIICPSKNQSIVDRTLNEDRRNTKITYTISIYGANAIGWMMTIYSLMSKRRKERIKEIIINWTLLRNRKLICKNGHRIENWNNLDGKCRVCYLEYHRNWYKNRKNRTA